MVIVLQAGFSRYGETGRNGEADPCHLGKTCSFAPEELLVVPSASSKR